MFKSVLLPLDGSVLSARALPYAKRSPRSRRPNGQTRSARPRRRNFETRIADSAQTLDVEDYFVEGAAADVIYQTAASTRANLIVISTHGHGGLGRWLYGSVADEVLRHVPVPVLLVSAVCAQQR